MVYFRQVPPNQELAFAFFEKVLAKNHLARAYLLCGGANTAKADLIVAINQILNCKLNQVGAGTYAPACGECTNCRWIASGTHPKTPLLLEGEGKKGNIKVERIRELQTELGQACDYFRIIVISDASRNGLNASSAAALLKTIEEAKANTMFMLIAESRDTVLPTISSRAQTINFVGVEEQAPSETSLAIYSELLAKLGSGDLESSLGQILSAEKFAEYESTDLISMLELWQNQISSELIGAATEDAGIRAEQIFKIDRAIADLKAFVRPKAALVGLLT